LSDGFVIVDPGMASALLSGRKTQLRLLAASAQPCPAAGDRLLVREACIAGRYIDGKVFSTALARAEFMIFWDGWRQHRDGSVIKGRAPTDPDHDWLPALRMPVWGARAMLVVDWSRTEPLQHITRRDIRAEGASALLGGLSWRWPRPIPGRRLTAHRAFAHYWDVSHASPGERWADDPLVHVVGFHRDSG